MSCESYPRGLSKHLRHTAHFGVNVGMRLPFLSSVRNQGGGSAVGLSLEEHEQTNLDITLWLENHSVISWL